MLSFIEMNLLLVVLTLKLEIFLDFETTKSLYDPSIVSNEESKVITPSLDLETLPGASCAVGLTLP